MHGVSYYFSPASRANRNICKMMGKAPFNNRIFVTLLSNNFHQTNDKVFSRMTLHQAEDVVLRLTQPGFIDILRGKRCDSSQEKKCFKIKSIDDGDVLDISVSSLPSEHPDTEDNQVAYELIKSFPVEEQKTELVRGVFKKLAESSSIQIALLITSDNQIKAYTRKTSSDLPKETKVLFQPSKDLLYSRSKGLLESGLLESRKVAIIGLGSGGSHVAIELAKAGIGNFVLVDYDRIELNNIVRHTCGVSDLGRLKTKAIRDRILDKNPFANVELHNCDINDPKKGMEILKGCDLIVAATDTRESRATINMISLELKIVTLYGKCAQRAAGGEVIVVRPNQGPPCFLCVCGRHDNEEEVSSLRQAKDGAPSYISDSELEATIQVGLSSDIIPISNMIVKIALVELCKDEDSALASLEGDFRYPYYVWANRCDAPYLKDYKEGNLKYFSECSVLRWYADSSYETCRDCLLEDAEEERDSSEDEK